MFEYIDMLAALYKKYLPKIIKKVNIPIKTATETKYDIIKMKEEFVQNTLPYINLLMALMWLARNYRYDTCGSV